MKKEQNAYSVLSDLVGTIQHFSDSMNRYLDHIGQQEVLNPLQQVDFVNSNEPIPIEFLERLGIRRLILNAFPGGSAFSSLGHIDDDKENITPRSWNQIKKDVIVEQLKTLFKSCGIIQFAEWTSVYNASDFWDGLLSDVIRPLRKKDFQFIFYLGDAAKKFVFETDEILDIMSDYSSCGKVTLVLYEHEADRLWRMLNGVNDGSTNSNIGRIAIKYSSFFASLNIDTLVIFAGERTTIVTKKQRFEFAGKSLKKPNVSKSARDCFDAGYQFGLLLQLSTLHSIALGLAISELCLENGSGPDQRALLDYIKDWIAELRTPGLLKNESKTINVDSVPR